MQEIEKRRKAEVAAHAALNGPRVRAYQYAGPDFEEGPHSALNEDEFFDALEMAYQSEEMEHQQDRSETPSASDGNPGIGQQVCMHSAGRLASAQRYCQYVLFSWRHVMDIPE